VDEIAVTVRKGIRWIERAQRRNGSWAGESPRSTLHATTRCVRALIGTGFPVSYPVVSKASSWLNRSEPEGSDYHYFWRLGALSELEGIAQRTLDHDFDAVVQIIDRGQMLDQRLNYRAFLLDCAANCGRGGSYATKAKELERQLAADSLDITPALWGFVGLERCGYNVDHLTGKIVDHIVRAVGQRTGYKHLNGLVVETSFLVFNVCRSRTLSADLRIKPIVESAARYIQSRQQTDGSWPPEPAVYNDDPKCDAYFTAVATRALAEYVKQYEPLKIADVFIPDWRLHVVLRSAVKLLAALFAVAAVVTVAVLLLPSRWQALITVLGVAASVIEIGVFATHIRRWLSGI
jgi:Prenyltransferase and squalene oxidase repeat